jgi:tripartite-type tricarboxylate transporter receptor subunit TctC
MNTARRTSTIAIAALATFALGIASGQQDDNWPSKTVKIIVPSAPGGGLDVGARVMAVILASEMGRPFIIENLPGAANMVGTAASARARPDGYTLLHASQSSICITPLITRNAGYKVSDLVPVSQTMATTNTLVVNPANLPGLTLPNLIQLLKANPGKYSYGSSGVGGWSHLIHELFALKTGTQMLHVPYSSPPAVKVAVMGRQIDMAIVSTSAVIEEIRNGKLLAVAVPTPQRLPELPNVPAINEIVPDFGGLETWNGFFLPTGTPQRIIDRLSAAVVRVVRTPSIAKQFQAMGAAPVGSTPEQFAALIQREVEIWRKLIADANISAE